MALWKVTCIAVILWTTLARFVLGDCFSRVLPPLWRCSDDVDLLCTQRIFFSEGSELSDMLRSCERYSRILRVTLKDASDFDIKTEEQYERNLLYDFSWRSTAVDASSNTLFYMPRKISTFINLERLNFSHNQLSEFNLHDFNECPFLQELDLSHNLIENISLYSPKFSTSHRPLQNLNNLTNLNLSHNYINMIPENLFKHVESLQYLDLSHNLISFLDSFTFDGLAKVIYLDISYNNITNLNFSLLRISDLVELHINNNGLSNVTGYDLRTASKLEILSLNNNLISSLATDSFDSLKRLKILNLSHNRVTYINKDYLTRNQELWNLDLSYNFIKKIDRGCFRNNDITLLNLENNHIEGTLQKGHFEGLNQVKFLNLSNQIVTQIDNLTFFGANELQYLNVSHNVIKLVSKYSLKGLDKLTTLDVSYNKLNAFAFDTTDLTQLTWLSLKKNNVSLLPAKLIDELVSLVYFDVSENNIMHLEKYTFKSLQNLNYINIDNNPLTGDLDVKTFYNLESVPHLDLSQTKISSVRNASLYGMKELFYFNISHSKLSTIEYNAFSHTGKLRILDVSYNKLTSFSVNNTNIATLNELIISHNLISHVDSNTFFNLFNLQRLYFSNNNLTQIANDSLSSLSNLRVLDVSFNIEVNLNLEFLPPLSVLTLSGIKKPFNGKSLKNDSVKLKELSLSSIQLTNVEILNLFVVPTLVKLDLGSNEISLIGKTAFNNLEYLETLQIQYNNISTIEAGSFKDLYSLTYLNLSHNKITSLGYGAFSGLLNLLSLDLSYNKISELNSQRFYYMPHLQFLIIDGNRISKIQFKELSQTHIFSLSLGDNDLYCSALIDHKKMYRDQPPILTAIVFNYNEKNVDGITCKEDYSIVPSGHLENTNISLIQLLYNSQTTNNILGDIKNILSNSTFNFNTTQSLSTNNNNDLSTQFMHNMSKVSQLLLKRIEQIVINTTIDRDKDIQMEIFNEIKHENVQMNNILKYLIEIATQKNVSVKESEPQKDFRLSETNTRSNDTSLYDIEKLKEEFKQYVAIERINIVNELKGYFRDSIPMHEHVFLNDSVKMADLDPNNNSPFNTTNKFTEVGVGIILVIILVFLAIKLYKYKNCIPKIRSYSTQEISNNIEMDRED